MDVLLEIIIAIVVFGVFVGVARFVIAKFFPEFMDYFQVIVWIAAAALFIYLLVAVWPFLTGAMRGRGRLGLGSNVNGLMINYEQERKS
jgi:Na+-driven multidrug efflux pump